MKWVIGGINAASLIIIVLLLSVEIPTFCIPFYKYEYRKNNTAQVVQVSDDGLTKVTEELLAYMRGSRPELDVKAIIDGRTREFFNEIEREHMRDVRGLFANGFVIKNIALLTFIISLVLLFAIKTKPALLLARLYRFFTAAVLLLSAAVALIVRLDFDRAFIVFHEIFFTNDLWILDASTDLLVNIVPIEFFIDIAIFILVIFFTTLLIIFITSTLFCASRNAKQPKKVNV